MVFSRGSSRGRAEVEVGSLRLIVQSCAACGIRQLDREMKRSERLELERSTKFTNLGE